VEVTVKTSEQKYDSEAKLADHKAVGDDSVWPEQDGKERGNSKLWRLGLFLSWESVP